jgi:hypothetical protein
VDWREELVRLEPEHRGAAEAILSKLDNGARPWGTKSALLGSKAQGPLAAFERLVEVGVLVSIGGTARSPVFAINRGESTAKLDVPKPAVKQKATRQTTPTDPSQPTPAPRTRPSASSKPASPKPSKAGLTPVDLGPLRQAIVAALAAARAPWLARAELCGSGKHEKVAYQQLVQDGTIVELGKLGKTDVVAASEGHSAADVQQDLAVELIVSRGTPGSLVALPIDPKDAYWKGVMPAQVLGSFNPALKHLLASGRALKLQGAGLALFVLASSIQAAAAELAGHTAASADAPARAPSPPMVNGIDSERVRGAYRQLATRQRAVHVTIADLWRDSGAPLPALKTWLLAECQAHRADPALGEPSLATPEQLAAALVIDGKPHLYIQLENA